MAELKERIAKQYNPDEFYTKQNLPKYIDKNLVIESNGKKKVVATQAMFENPKLQNVRLEQGYVYIQDLAFAKSSVKKVEIERGLLGIDAMAFADCVDMEEILLPNTLKYIGRETFQNCYSLEAIILPPSVEAVGVDIFKKCANLRTICCGEKLIERISEWKRNCVDLTKVYIIDDDYQVQGCHKVGAYSQNYPTIDRQFTKLEKALGKKLEEARKRNTPASSGAAAGSSGAELTL